ncbi:hypothetical protein Q3G72_032155 [Acer saccharum]|nr:hypothetical protein Q3G72_032155 [Acer saccharum]
MHSVLGYFAIMPIRIIPALNKVQVPDTGSSTTAGNFVLVAAAVYYSRAVVAPATSYCTGNDDFREAMDNGGVALLVSKQNTV